MKPRAPKGKFRRRMELDGTWWAEDQEGAWFVWSRPAADWLPAGDRPAIPPADPGPGADPWARQSVPDSLREFFGTAGPGRNLLLALLIVAGITAGIWVLSFAFDPFGIQEPRQAFWLFDVFPKILAAAAMIGVVVGGIIRVGQGKPFFPPEVRALHRARGRARDWPREIATALTVWAAIAFLMWWLFGYLKPFGVSIIEFGPWENTPPLLYLALGSAAAAAIAWTWALGRPRKPPPTN